MNLDIRGSNEDIEPDRLLLDSGNLRLMEHVGEDLLNTEAPQIGTSPIQERLLQTFASEPRFKIDALIKSISGLGFLRNDRLIVAPYDGGKFLVLEGNRRLSAVKWMLRNTRLAQRIASTVQTLPCFVIDGPPISGSEELLNKYRHAALQYIGVRHLTGIQQWEPASRYEFLARLIEEEKMPPDEVAERFGIALSAVMRDYRAHLLYKKFREHEEQRRIRKHSLTYNTFAEATRSPDIRTWLGWSDQTQTFTSESRISVFFDYVLKQLGASTPSLFGESEEDWTPEESAEAVVRRFRDMLKRQDPEIESNLEQRDFAKAHELFDLRKLGRLEQRLKGYISGLKSVSKSEMQENPTASAKLLGELSQEALELKNILQKL